MSVFWEITIDRTTVAGGSSLFGAVDTDQVASVYFQLTYVKDFYLGFELGDPVWLGVCPGSSYGPVSGEISYWKPRTHVTLADGTGFWATIQGLPPLDPEDETTLEADDRACFGNGTSAPYACDAMSLVVFKSFKCVALPVLGSSLTESDNPLYALGVLLASLAWPYDLNAVTEYCASCG